MPGSADIELKVEADFTSFNSAIDKNKQKLQELQQAHNQLTRDIKDDTASLKANEAAIKDTSIALSKLKAEGKGASAAAGDLKNKLKELSVANIDIKNGVVNSQIALKENAKALREQTKVMEAGPIASSKFVSGLGTVFGALRKVSYIIPGIGIAGLISLIAGPAVKAFTDWAGITGKAAEQQKKIAEYTEKAVSNISKEASEVTQLVAVASSDVQSKEARFAAIKKLQEIAPQYFSNLDTEKDKIGDITLAYQGYLESLEQRIRLETNKSALTDNLKEQISLGDKIKEQTAKQSDNENKIIKRREKANKALKEGAINTYQSLSAEIAGLQQEGVLNKMKSDLSDLKKEAGKLTGSITQATVFLGVNEIYAKLSEQIGRLNNQEITFGTNEAQKKIDAVKSAIDSLQNSFGVPLSDPRIQSLLKSIEIYEKALPPVKAHSSALKNNAKEIETVDSVLRKMNESLANSTTLEKAFGDDRSKDKINAISKAIEDLVIKLKVATDSDLILKLKKQIADIETSQKIDFNITPVIDFTPEVAKLSDNSKVLNALDNERKALIERIKKAGFDRLPTGISFDEASKKDLLDFFGQIQQSAIDTAMTITQVLSPAFDSVFDAIFNGQNAFDALRNALQRIIQDLITAAAKAAIFALITNVISGGAVSFGKAFGKAFGFADGGLVRGKGYATGGYISGPGTPKSDSIPAWLSNGEYVIKASIVNKLGRNFFDAINFGKMIPRQQSSHFADGGYVGNNLTAITGSGIKLTGEFKLRNNVLAVAVERGNSQLNRLS